MTKFIALIMTMTISFAAQAFDFFDYEFPIDASGTKIMVGSYAARNSDRATVIYLHGYADTFNNHEELLSQLHDAGARVIAFDYPSHGQSEGGIWAWDIKDVAGIINTVLENPALNNGVLTINRNLPVILVGWSTGATMAIRTAQSWKSTIIPRDMNLAGVVAFAPALPAKALVGDGISRWGIKVKAEDLTQNTRAIKYAPKPESTLASGPFAISLATSSVMAKISSAPEIPTLVFAADHDKDFFALADSSANWVKHSRTTPTYGFQCKGARHGLEFEPDGVGELTKLLTIEFVQRLAQPNGNKAKREIEQSFRSRTYKICPAVHKMGQRSSWD